MDFNRILNASKVNPLVKYAPLYKGFLNQAYLVTIGEARAFLEEIVGQVMAANSNQTLPQNMQIVGIPVFASAAGPANYVPVAQMLADDMPTTQPLNLAYTYTLNGEERESEVGLLIRDYIGRGNVAIVNALLKGD